MPVVYASGQLEEESNLFATVGFGMRYRPFSGENFVLVECLFMPGTACHRNQILPSGTAAALGKPPLRTTPFQSHQ